MHDKSALVHSNAVTYGFKCLKFTGASCHTCHSSKYFSVWGYRHVTSSLNCKKPLKIPTLLSIYVCDISKLGHTTENNRQFNGS